MPFAVTSESPPHALEVLEMHAMTRLYTTALLGSLSWCVRSQCQSSFCDGVFHRRVVQSLFVSIYGDGPGSIRCSVAPRVLSCMHAVVIIVNGVCMVVNVALDEPGRASSLVLGFASASVWASTEALTAPCVCRYVVRVVNEGFPG